MTAYTASIGTISHGTLRAADLIISFADELRNFEPDCDLVKEADAVQTLWAGGWNAIYDSEEAMNLVDELQDALSTNAPPYCYFGNTEGDGSDFGFWPSMGAIDELPRVSDPNEIPEGGTGEDVAYVNDHGNVTVYGADGKVLIDFV